MRTATAIAWVLGPGPTLLYAFVLRRNTVLPNWMIAVTVLSDMWLWTRYYN